MNARPAPNDRLSRHGFTLVEVLVATLITSLIMIATLTVLDQSRSIARRNLAIGEAQQTASYGLQEMATNVRKAGYNLGPSAAIVGSQTIAGSAYVLTYDNFTNVGAIPYGPYNLVTTDPGGPFIPVVGTDAITVRYTDDKPPIHVCVMPGGNANNMDLSWDPAYASSYPVDGQWIDLLTTTTCPLGTPASEPYVVSTQINNGPTGTVPTQCSNAGGGGGAGSCYANDPQCTSLQLTKSCYHVTFVAATKPACDLCMVGPTYMLATTVSSYWISTEDHTGVLSANTHPVLVSRTGLAGAAKIIATDVEDLQIRYLSNTALDNLYDFGAAGVPASNTFRAARLTLVGRTPQTDLMAKTQAYCAARMNPGQQALFTRPAIFNHTAPTSGTGYCDGYRRYVADQMVFLPNMESHPLGK